MAHYCFLHGVNLAARGALYSMPWQFALMYKERTKTAVNFALTDMYLKGVSFLNLQWIMYNPKKDEWHSPALAGVIERLVIREILDKEVIL